jgi:uncharacterized protein (TIGR02271 family)
MSHEKIVTLYDTAEHADAARRTLEMRGFSPSEISSVSNKTLAAAGETLREPGLWRRLFGRDITAHEATVYGQTVEAGGVVLTVRAAEADVARAMAILNAHQVVDVQKRAMEQGLISSTPTREATTSAPTQPIKRAVADALGREEVLRLAEEELSLGKQLIQEGTTRIRRFIVEKPVEAQITLHEEHVKVVRRAVADPGSLQDIDWTERTVEITDTIEEPVVKKTSHIAEEILIRKEGSDHTETVRDTVRRQQVEVESLPAETRTKASTKTTTPKP